MILLSRLSILLLLVFTEIQRIKGEVNGRCEGRNGVCVSTQSCAKSGGTYESKFCPHDPENIKCCNKNCTVKNGEKGVCMFKSDCKGTTYTGYCPGGDNFLCCVTKSSPPPPKTSAVKKSNVSANTVINNKSPAPKAEPNVNNAPKVNNKVTTIYITAVKTEPYVSSVPKVSDNPIKDNYSVVTSTSKETNVSSTPGRSNSRGEDTNKNNESKNKPIIYIAAIGGGLFILCTVFFLMNRRNRFKKEEHKNKTLEFNVDSEGNTNTLIYKQINKSDNDNDIVVYKRHNVKSHPEDAIENTEYENEERRLINQQSLLMNSNSNSTLEYISSSLTPQAHIDFRESEIIPYSNNTNTNTNNSFDGRSVTLTKNTVPTIISDNSNVTVTIDRNETFLPPYSPPVRQSPNEVRYSQNEVRYSPSVVNHSPLEMKYSPVEIKHSPVEIKYSPVEIKHSPIELKHSNIPFGTSKHI